MTACSGVVHVEDDTLQILANTAGVSSITTFNRFKSGKYAPHCGKNPFYIILFKNGSFLLLLNREPQLEMQFNIFPLYCETSKPHSILEFLNALPYSHVIRGVPLSRPTYDQYYFNKSLDLVIINIQYSHLKLTNPLQTPMAPSP